MKVDKFNHLIHPFSQGSIKLKGWQKGIALTGLILTPLFILPGLLAFYGLSYYFKATQLHLHEQDNESPASRTNSVSTRTLSQNDRGAGDSARNLKESLIPSNKILRALVIDSGALDNHADAEREELKHLHHSSEVQDNFDDLRSADHLDNIAILEELKKQAPHWPEYLRYLAKYQSEDFNILFVVALESVTPDLADFNEYLESLSNCQLIFGNQVLPAHSTVLRRISPYFDKMFSSGMREAQTNSIYLPKQDYELFKNLLPRILKLHFFARRLDLSEDNLTQYLHLAEEYQFPLVKEACEKWILANLENIDMNDQHHLFNLADQYHLESVKSQMVHALVLSYRESTNEAKRIKKLVKREVATVEKPKKLPELNQAYLKSMEESQSQTKLLEKWLQRVRDLELTHFSFNMLEFLLKSCAEIQTLKITIYDKKSINLLKTLSKLQGLELEMDISSGKNNAEAIKELQGIPISSLEIRSSKVTDQELAYLKNLPLQSLALQFTKSITDQELAHLKGLPLKSLILLNGERITDRGLAHLKDLPLKSLDLYRCPEVTDQGLMHLNNLPLESLTIHLCPKITGQGLATLKNLPLKTLHLKWYEITDQDLAHLKDFPIKSLISIMENNPSWDIRFDLGIDLSYDQITNQGLAYLEGLPLESLTLLGARQITDQGLVHLKNLPLTSLTLETEQITDKGLAQLTGLSLKSLTLKWNNKMMTRQGVALLNSLHLETLTIQVPFNQENKVTRKVMTSLRRKMPDTSLKFDR